MKEGDHRTACEKFRHSFARKATVGTQLNLAICEEKLGHLVRSFELSSELVEAMPADDARLTLAKEHLSGLKRRLAMLTVLLDPRAPEGTVAQDLAGKRWPIGVVVPLLPGEHGLSVSAPHHGSRRYVVSLGPAQSETLTVEPGPTSQPRRARQAVDAAVEPSAAQDESVSRGTWGGVVLGTGGVALATSAVAATLLWRQWTVVKAECSRDTVPECTSRGEQAKRRGRTYDNVATAGFAVGLVAGGIGAYLLLSDDVAIQAGAAPGQSQLVVHARF
jgi:hypothetical protein